MPLEIPPLVSPRGKSIVSLTTRRAQRCRYMDHPGTAAPAPGRPCRTPRPRRRRSCAPADRRPSVMSSTASSDECPPRHQHRDAALRAAPVLQLVDGDVGREVVDAVQRLVERERQPLGGGDTDEQRAGETGPAGDRDRVDVGRLDPRGRDTPARSSGPSPRGARGWRPPVRRRRTARAPRHWTRPRRRAASARGPSRRRSRRTTSRSPESGARQPSPLRPARRTSRLHDHRIVAAGVVPRSTADLREAVGRSYNAIAGALPAATSSSTRRARRAPLRRATPSPTRRRSRCRRRPAAPRPAATPPRPST